jgi:hypothetical protein
VLSSPLFSGFAVSKQLYRIFRQFVAIFVKALTGVTVPLSGKLLDEKPEVENLVSGSL